MRRPRSVTNGSIWPRPSRVCRVEVQALHHAMHVTQRNPDRSMPLRRMPLLRHRLLALLPTVLLAPVLAWSQASGRVKTDEVQARAGRPCARGRGGRQAGVARPADPTTRRTGTPTGRTRATRACRRRCAWTLPAGVGGRRDRLADAEAAADRPAGQLRLRGHGAAAGAARPSRRRSRGDALDVKLKRRLAGVQGGLHPGGGRVRAAACRRSRARRARRGVRAARGARPAARRRSASRAGARSTRRRCALERSTACRRRCTASAGVLPRDAGVIDHAARGRARAGTATGWRRACRCRRSAARARRDAGGAVAAGATAAARCELRGRRRRLAGGRAARAGLPRGGRRAATRRRGAAASSLARRSAFALLGGLLLNLMPCVFPVLSLKVLGFAAPRRRPRARIAPAGWPTPPAWCCPSSRWPALLLALRAGGEQLGWGFQLQSPAVVAALAALFTLIGAQPGRACSSSATSLPGRLAALRSAPSGGRRVPRPACSRWRSPRPAPRRSWAPRSASRSTLPAPQALAVFAALGVGMALPYLAASLCAGLARAAAAARARGWRASSS